METTIFCPVWCDRTLGHEYEDESRAGEPISHHVREVLTITAMHFGDPVEVSVSVGSTEQVTMNADGVKVAASAPAVWVNAENLETFNALGFDLDPEQAMLLGHALIKAANLAGRGQLT